MRFLFITNFCPHYRVRTYEVLAGLADVRFVFFSAGDEWYWGQRHGRQAGAFPHEYLRGFHLTPWVRVTPRLLPIVWRYDGDVILKCITGRFALPVALLLAKLRRKPFVLWTGIWQHPQTVFHRLTYPVTRMVYRMSDAIVVYGRHVKDYLVSLGVDEQKIFIAPHAVDNDMYSRTVDGREREALRERLGVGDSAVILYVGRLEESKGLDVLLDAFAAWDPGDTALVLVGQGRAAADLKDRAARLGIEDRVVFAGYVAPDEAVAFYSIGSVLVLPSVSVRAGREPWGLVVNEAMNQGLPVIATDAVGAARGGLVQDGVNGLIVAERDAIGLRKALERVMTDQRLRQSLGDAARRVIAGWDNMRMAEGFLAACAYAHETRRGTAADSAATEESA